MENASGFVICFIIWRVKNKNGRFTKKFLQNKIYILVCIFIEREVKMKKILCLALMLAMGVNVAKADTIVVIDGEGRVTKQMFTVPTTFDVPVATTKTTTSSAAVTVPQVMVVRESPVIQNSYYYDRDVTKAALAAGVTAAVVGGVIYNGYHHDHRHKRGGYPHYRRHPRPHRW